MSQEQNGSQEDKAVIMSETKTNNGTTGAVPIPMIFTTSQDVLYKVMEYLETKEILRVLSTCKLLHRLGNDSVLWKLHMEECHPEAFHMACQSYEKKIEKKDEFLDG